MKSLRTRIALILAAAAALPLLVMAVAQAQFSARVLAASRAALESARLDELSNDLRDDDLRVRHELDEIARRWDALDARELAGLVDGDPRIARVSTTDRAGAVKLSTDPQLAGRILDLGDLFASGGVQVRAENGRILYAQVASRTGVTRGAVVAELPIEQLAAPLRRMLDNGFAAVLHDRNGRTLWQPAQGPIPDGDGAPNEFRTVAGTPWSLTIASRGDGVIDGVRSVQDVALVVCAVVLVLAFFVQALAVRRAFQPLEQMTGAALDVARGDYDARLPIDGHAELDALAIAFNEMAAALQGSHRDLEDKVRERTQALEEMNLAMAARNRELGERSEELARHRYHEQSKGRALAALTADAELDRVIGAALGELAGPTGAAVMICYRLEGAELAPVADYAASEAARTMVVPLAGMAEEAMRKGRPQSVDFVPDDFDLRFDCLVAAGKPRNVMLVPLKVGNRANGLLVVGALHPLVPEAVTTLVDLAAPLALTMARRALLDHTERIARELARRNEELREQTDALAAQGEELKAQKQELSVKNLEVQKADKLKSEFLANMSHELRTPLNAVIGFSELLLDDRTALSPAQAQWSQDIHESGRHLLTLINRVLDLAKIEAGRTTLSVEPLPPDEAVASACALIRAAAAKKKIAIDVTATPLVRPVRADRARLQQVLLNLLANAVKFSPDGAPIAVGFAEEGERVRFFVRDQGPGIDAETQRCLFQPFFQAESPLVKKHEGTGLGLAISRKLVEAQGGSMGVESEPGKGSTFFFTLPLAVEAPAPDPASLEAPRPELRGERVLVVDDHGLNRDLARELLERRGCEVLLACDGEEGLATARRERPALVLLDLAMPRKDGFAVARELKQDPATRDIPLVAMTALAMRGDDERALQAGFDAYLPKPLERNALDATLARFFGHRAAAA